MGAAAVRNVKTERLAQPGKQEPKQILTGVKGRTGDKSSRPFSPFSPLTPVQVFCLQNFVRPVFPLHGSGIYFKNTPYSTAPLSLIFSTQLPHEEPARPMPAAYPHTVEAN